MSLSRGVDPVKKSFLFRTCAFVGMPIAASVVPTAASFAQQITTSITGQVTNESGAAVGGSTVIITDTRNPHYLVVL